LIIFGAKYLIFIIVLLTLVAGWQLKGKKRWQFVAALVAASILAVVFSKSAGKIYYHPRPFVVQNIKPLIAHGADNGFPSEHTILAAILSTIIYFYKRKWATTAFVLTLLVGVGRVLAHVHSPIDILGGLVLGGLAGRIGYDVAKRLFPGGQQAAVDKQHH